MFYKVNTNVLELKKEHPDVNLHIQKYGFGIYSQNHISLFV